MDILSYEQMTKDELKSQLIRVTRDLSYWYEELGQFTQDHRRAYLTAYIQSPGGSVAAKEKDAEFQTVDQANNVTDAEFRIESLTVTFSLLEILLDA